MVYRRSGHTMNGVSDGFEPGEKGAQVYRRRRFTRYRVQAVRNDVRLWMLMGVIAFLGLMELVLSIPIISLPIRLVLVILHENLQLAFQ